MQKVLYVPGQMNLITFLVDGHCHISGATIEEVQARYPEAIEMDYDAASDLIDQAIAAKYLTGPEEITEAKFIEMLGVLPPEKWFNDGSSESFMLAELLVGNIGTFYARIGKRYYSVNAPSRTEHAEIIASIIRSCVAEIRKSPA